MSSKMKDLSKRLMKSDGIPDEQNLLNFFNEFLIWLNTGFNKTRPLPKGQINKYITMSIPLLLDINLDIFVNLTPIVLKILAILVHPQTDKDIRETVWRLSISLIDSKTQLMTPNSWAYLIESAFSKKERDPNFNSGTPSIYSYESNCNLLLIYLNIITSMCSGQNINQDFVKTKKKVIYHWELISELIFTHIFNTTSENKKTLNPLCYLILQCINTCQKTFKIVFLDTDIGSPQMINYLLDILLKIGKQTSDDPPNENAFKLLYKFYKFTFPCQIFAMGQNSIPYECKKKQQIAERITPIINRNYLFLSMNNNTNNNSNISNNTSNSSGSSSPNNRSSLNKVKFTINPLLLCCFDAIPSDESISLLKKMSQNCKNFSPILINSIFIMINLIYPLLNKIESKAKYINSNFFNYNSIVNSNYSGNYNNNDNSNINVTSNPANLKIIDKAYLSFTTSDANTVVITSIAQLFSHIMRLRSLMQVIMKSSIDSSTFSAIISLFFNVQKKEMYPFLVTVFFSILFDRRYIDMRKERDYILLLMSFKFNMSYMPNLFSRLASQLSVALSTFIINIPEDSSREIQGNPILFDEKEIVNPVLVEIGKVTTDSLFFYFPFISNEFSVQTAKDFLINMIQSFDPLFNNYISMAVTGAILSIIKWLKRHERDRLREQQQQQLQQQQIIERNLRLNLRKKRNRPKSHDYQPIKIPSVQVSSDYRKMASSSLVLPSVITKPSPIISRNSNLVLDSTTNLIIQENTPNSNSNVGANSMLDSSPPSSSSFINPGESNLNQKNDDDNNNTNNNQQIPEILYEAPFYIDNVLFLKDLDLSFLFGYLLPYLMKSLVKTLDVNDKKAQEEINKKLNYFVSWFEEDLSPSECQSQIQSQEKEVEKNQEQKKNNLLNLKKQSKKRMQIVCFNLIFKLIKLAHKLNLFTEKLARDWCKLLVMYVEYSTKVQKETLINEVVLAIIECVLGAYPLSFSLIPVLSQAFCNVDFASFQNKDKIKIITYLVSVCSMIKKTIDKSKVTFIKYKVGFNGNDDSTNKKNATGSNCSFIDVRADTFAVLTHAFEGLEEVSENIDAASFSLFIDDLYSSDDTMFKLTETLVLSRLAHFEKKPSLTFCRLLLCLFPTHLDMVIKKCSKDLYNHFIEVPFNVLLKHEVRTSEIYDLLSQCLVDIILTLQNGPIFNKTLAFITIETVPDENQKILSERTKFLIANFNKPNGVIDININNNIKNGNNNNKTNDESNKQPKHSYYAISQNGAFYCVKNYQGEKSLESAKKSNDNENDKENGGFFVVESSLPLGSSRYRITPSNFLTIPQKSKFKNVIKSSNFSTTNDKLKPIPISPQKVCISSNSYMFSQVPSSALLFRVLSHFSQSTMKFSISLKNQNRPPLPLSQSTESDSPTLSAQSSFSAIPKPTKLLTSEMANNNSSSLKNNAVGDNYPLPGFDEKSSIRSRSMNNIASQQKGDFSDQKIAFYTRKMFKRSQRTQLIFGVIYMEKGQILNLNADYCLSSNFFDAENSNAASPNNDENNEADLEKVGKESALSSFDDAESGLVDSIIEEKVSFITQTPWKSTTKQFKEFMSSLGAFQRRGKPLRKKPTTATSSNDELNSNQNENGKNQNKTSKSDTKNENDKNKTKNENETSKSDTKNENDKNKTKNENEASKSDTKNESETNKSENDKSDATKADPVLKSSLDVGEVSNDLISIHYVDFHTDAIFLVGPLLCINSYNNCTFEGGQQPSQDSYGNSCRIKNNLWKAVKNSRVLIIWNEDSTKLAINEEQQSATPSATSIIINNININDSTSSNSMNSIRVFIVISPLRNNLYKVSVIENFNQKLFSDQQQKLQQLQQQLQNPLSYPSSAPKVEELIKMSPGPLFGDTIVPKRSLGELVRATAIYEDRKVKSLIDSKEKEDVFIELVCQEIERKKKGRRFAFNSNQPFDLKNQKKKKKKILPRNEDIFYELWKEFPDSFSFFY